MKLSVIETKYDLNPRPSMSHSSYQSIKLLKGSYSKGKKSKFSHISSNRLTMEEKLESSLLKSNSSINQNEVFYSKLHRSRDREVNQANIINMSKFGINAATKVRNTVILQPIVPQSEEASNLSSTQPVSLAMLCKSGKMEEEYKSLIGKVSDFSFSFVNTLKEKMLKLKYKSEEIHKMMFDHTANVNKSFGNTVLDLESAYIDLLDFSLTKLNSTMALNDTNSRKVCDLEKHLVTKSEKIGQLQSFIESNGIEYIAILNKKSNLKISETKRESELQLKKQLLNSCKQEAEINELLDLLEKTKSFEVDNQGLKSQISDYDKRLENQMLHFREEINALTTKLELTKGDMLKLSRENERCNTQIARLEEENRGLNMQIISKIKDLKINNQKLKEYERGLEMAKEESISLYSLVFTQ